MENTRSADDVPSPTAGWRSQVGIRKLRPPEVTRKIEDLGIRVEKPTKTFEKPITVTLTSGFSTTDFEVPHTLGVIPSDMLIGVRSADVTLWKGDKDWTRDNIYIRASGAVTVTLYLVP